MTRGENALAQVLSWSKQYGKNRGPRGNVSRAVKFGTMSKALRNTTQIELNKNGMPILFRRNSANQLNNRQRKGVIKLGIRNAAQNIIPSGILVTNANSKSNVPMGVNVKALNAQRQRELNRRANSKLANEIAELHAQLNQKPTSKMLLEFMRKRNAMSKKRTAGANYFKNVAIIGKGSVPVLPYNIRGHITAYANNLYTTRKDRNKVNNKYTGKVSHFLKN